MKKISCIILSLIFFSFLIPFIFTKPFETVSQKIEEEKPEEEAKISYDYREFNTIKLYHTKTEQIEEVALEEYLYHVVSAEMPADFEMEALKAQALVARTYTIYQIMHNQSKHGEASICDSSTCCQAWISKEDRLARWDESVRESNWNKIVEAVDSTCGKVITYEGEPINAFFHSNSGGTTEMPINVWGGSGYPYLQAVETSGEDAYSQYYSEVELTKEEVIEKIKQTHTDIVIDFNEENAISILEYTRKRKNKNNSIWKCKLIRSRGKNHFWTKISKLYSANFRKHRKIYSASDMVMV